MSHIEKFANFMFLTCDNIYLNIFTFVTLLSSAIILILYGFWAFIYLFVQYFVLKYFLITSKFKFAKVDKYRYRCDAFPNMDFHVLPAHKRTVLGRQMTEAFTFSYDFPDMLFVSYGYNHYAYRMLSPNLNDSLLLNKFGKLCFRGQLYSSCEIVDKFFTTCFTEYIRFVPYKNQLLFELNKIYGAGRADYYNR